MSAMTPADPNSPLMQAWRRYQESPDFFNTLTSARKVETTEGCLWAAFARGFRAATELDPIAHTWCDYNTATKR